MDESTSFKEDEIKKQYNLKELREVIAKSLSQGPKTDDDLRKEIPKAKYEEILNVLKNMLSLKLIKKDGFPVKYSLSEGILKTLEKRKELSDTDKHIIRANLIIESKSNDKGLLRTAMEKILDSLKKDENYFIYESSLAEIIVHDDLFSTYISAEVSCSDLFNLFRLVYFYGVTSIDIIKPDKLNVPISDLQNSLTTIVDMIHGYADLIYELKSKNDVLSKRK
jgi:hypothetical protein